MLDIDSVITAEGFGRIDISREFGDIQVNDKSLIDELYEAITNTKENGLDTKEFIGKVTVVITVSQEGLVVKSDEIGGSENV